MPKACSGFPNRPLVLLVVDIPTASQTHNTTNWHKLANGTGFVIIMLVSGWFPGNYSLLLNRVQSLQNRKKIDYAKGYYFCTNGEHLSYH